MATNAAAAQRRRAGGQASDAAAAAGATHRNTARGVSARSIARSVADLGLGLGSPLVEAFEYEGEGR